MPFNLSEFTVLDAGFASTRCSISVCFSLFNYLVLCRVWGVVSMPGNPWLYLYGWQEVGFLQLPLELCNS